MTSSIYGDPPRAVTGPPAPAEAVEIVPLGPEVLRIDRWNALYAAPPLMTLALIAALATIYAATAWEGGDLYVLARWGAKVATRIDRGEWWRVVTASWLHGNLLHLLSNAVGLYVIGRQCENLFSRPIFFALFVLTGAAAETTSMLRTTGLSVGASGPIFGLIGATISFHARRRAEVPHMHRGTLVALALWAVFSIGVGMAQPEIDNWAHGGGLAAGLLLGLAIPSPVREDAARARRGIRMVFAIPAAALLGASGALLARAATAEHGVTTYRHLPAGFRIAYPSEWTRRADRDVLIVSDDLGGAVCLARAPVDDAAHAADDLADACAGDPSRLGRMRESGAPRGLTVAGRAWRHRERTLRVGDDVELRQRIDTSESAGWRYTVVAESPAESWTHYTKRFDAILASFELP